MLLQFIKDCAYDVAASENTTTVPGVKPDIALRCVYIPARWQQLVYVFVSLVFHPYEF